MSLTNLSTKRQRIAELARTKRGVALSKLHHVIDLEWMKEAYRLTRKDGAPGIDDVTADDYAINLDANLLDLLDRIKSGHYKAPPAGGLPWLASALTCARNCAPYVEQVAAEGRAGDLHPRRRAHHQLLGTAGGAFTSPS